MTSTTSEARSLAEALAGEIGVAAFDADIREQLPVFFKGALKAEVALSLFDVSRLEQALDGPGEPAVQAEIYASGHMLRLADIHRRSGKTPASVAADHLAQGATIRFRDVDRFDPALGAFAAAVAQVYAARVQINAYLTPPAQAGFPPHFDNTDVFILQVVGSKEWRVHRDYSNRVPLPDPDTPWDADKFRPTGSEEQHRLSVGDVLYLPRGEMHSARCSDEESLHLTISLTPLSIADLLVREIRRLAHEEEGLRRRALWSVASRTPQQQAHLTESLQHWLGVITGRLDPDASLQTERIALSPDAGGAKTGSVGALHRCLADLKTGGRALS